jgi:hypothetical protein
MTQPFQREWAFDQRVVPPARSGQTGVHRLLKSPAIRAARYEAHSITLGLPTVEDTLAKFETEASLLALQQPPRSGN